MSAAKEKEEKRAQKGLMSSIQRLVNGSPKQTSRTITTYKYYCIHFAQAGNTKRRFQRIENRKNLNFKCRGCSEREVILCADDEFQTTARDQCDIIPDVVDE